MFRPQMFAIFRLYNENLSCVEIKCQLDATEVFIADLIASNKIGNKNLCCI